MRTVRARRRTWRHERDEATISLFEGTRWKTKGGCGSGPTIINRDWPVGPTTGATWLDEPDPSVHQVRKTHLKKPCLRGWEWWSWMNVTRYRGSTLRTWTNEFEASILLYTSATIFLIASLVGLDAIRDLWKVGVRIVKVLLYRQLLIRLRWKTNDVFEAEESSNTRCSSDDFYEM